MKNWEKLFFLLKTPPLKKHIDSETRRVKKELCDASAPRPSLYKTRRRGDEKDIQKKCAAPLSLNRGSSK